MIENKGECTGDTAAKLKGYLKKFVSYNFLASLHFYRQVLHKTAHLSYVMQTKSALIIDVIDAISSVKRILPDFHKLRLTFHIMVTKTKTKQCR